MKPQRTPRREWSKNSALHVSDCFRLFPGLDLGGEWKQEDVLMSTTISRHHAANTLTDPEAELQEGNPEYEELYAPTFAMHDAGCMQDLKERWPQLAHADLARIPVLATGARLVRDAEYFDMQNPKRGIFQATLGKVAEPANWFVARQDVRPELWKLITDTGDSD